MDTGEAVLQYRGRGNSKKLAGYFGGEGRGLPSLMLAHSVGQLCPGLKRAPGAWEGGSQACLHLAISEGMGWEGSPLPTYGGGPGSLVDPTQWGPPVKSVVTALKQGGVGPDSWPTQ